MLKKIFLSEKIILTAIVLNAILMTLMLFPEQKYHQLFCTLDYFFIGFFMLEVIVKVQEWGLKKYLKSNLNKLDFVVVSVSSLVIINLFYPLPDVSLILAFRLFRLFRLTRLLTFIPNIDNLIEGLQRAFQACVFVLLVLLGYNFILAIFGCFLYQKVSPEYFGDPFISSYTIFQLFTVEGWNEIAGVVSQSTQNRWAEVFTKIFFIFIVFSGGILGFSLVNAIFVDEMTLDNNDELEIKVDELKEQVEELKILIKKQ